MPWTCPQLIHVLGLLSEILGTGMIIVEFYQGFNFRGPPTPLHKLGA
jgi:hypothetical protein